MRVALYQLDRKQVLRGVCIQREERFLPWSELDLTWIDESKSTLIISRRGQCKHWAIAPLYHITNAALCLRLMDQLIREKAHELA
ncbi:hypothetical protein KSD_70690 [Ktedonobacter sp. SOSP1-85]|nr:hypothetical protein KSD_70690 [Ktedonobacter sp. SOSP1-85]